MKQQNLINTLFAGMIIGAVSLASTGCGLQDQNLKKDAKADNSTDVKNDQGKKASLSLALPTNLPAAVDEVQVTLQRIQPYTDPCGTVLTSGKNFPLGRPCVMPLGPLAKGDVLAPARNRELIAGSTTSTKAKKEKAAPSATSDASGFASEYSITDTFHVKGEPIELQGLDAGEYYVIIDLIDSTTGTVYSHGEGTASVVAGVQAIAHISMSKVDNTTGGLVIVLEDAPATQHVPTPAPAPGQICPAFAMLPLCVAKGNSYKVYDFATVPGTCNFLPMPADLEQVSNAKCKGLPGADRLWPQNF